MNKTVTALIASVLWAGSASAQTFINELHYDNDGTDANERVEIAGPAGASLAGWKVVLYNGGDGKSYQTINLSGTIANQCGGFGTLSFAATGMQNGAPDGLALLNAGGSVVEFLSYEGSFRATDGAANGLTAVDIGVSEGTGVTSSQSLQRRGSGNTAAAFTFAAPATASFGSCNSGQTFTGGTGGGTPGSTALSNGVTLSGLSGSSGSDRLFTLAVPTGASNLRFTLSGGTGDADLYVRRGSAPTTSTYDCRSWVTGNTESCTISAPTSGTWHVLIRGYQTYSGVSLLGRYDSTPAPTGYYASVNTSTSATLRSTLHAVIDDHKRFPYTSSTETDVWDILERADQDPLNSSRILDVYKNASYVKAGGGNNFYNREHTWPKSLGFPNDSFDNYPYTDTHMLMASDISHNSARGNLPFGNCNNSGEAFATQVYNGAGGSGQSNWRCGGFWQTWNKLKGNMARAMFYMDIRYEGGTHGVTGVSEPDLRLTDNASLITQSSGNASVAYMGLLSVLLQWHNDDPVDAGERLRNDLVQTYQGNRNPFVDRPEWARCIYQSQCN